MPKEASKGTKIRCMSSGKPKNEAIFSEIRVVLDLKGTKFMRGERSKL